MSNIQPLSSDILAVNLDALGSPSIDINLAHQLGGSHSLGWGFGWYPGDEASSMVLKDPAARGANVLTNAIADWSNFRSHVFFCKVRGAESDYSHTETQPFSRSYAGRDWLFVHNGDLDKAALQALHGRQKRLLEPIGGTDSELAFCNLLSQIQEGDARKLADLDPTLLHSWFQRFDALGSADMFITDGQSIACFQGSQSPKRLNYGRIQPPDNQKIYESDAVQIALNDPRDTFRTALVVSSSRFREGNWNEMQPGQMIIARRGVIVWDSALGAAPQFSDAYPAQPEQPQQRDNFMAAVQAEQAQSQGASHITVITNPRSITQTTEGKSLSYRSFEVTHASHYAYSATVEHSTHLFRLQPTVDPIQDVVHSAIEITSDCEKILFEDVFCNQALHCTIDTPYKTLSVTATSRVKIFEAPPDDHSLTRRRASIPLIWMPWQREMMAPYLLPPELPETQLRELTEYAMSFVERNDYHLLKTLNDINLSIYRDYKYVPKSTSLNTTPFEVYANREGVCQDFANLFICLARLLSVPSRYRMGYIYTGANYENKIQSDASHAWAEFYLPYVGWRGFDPTNGCMVAQDHIRVACGRNYIDATPTSGTIYKGGGDETLTIDVKVTEIND